MSQLNNLTSVIKLNKCWYRQKRLLKFDVELINPIAMEQGLRFAIREGGRTVGSGVVSKIIA